LKFRVSRRGVILGVAFGIAATLSGIFVIKYTEMFMLVVMLWVVAPFMILQFVRWVRAKLRRE